MTTVYPYLFVAKITEGRGQGRKGQRLRIVDPGTAKVASIVIVEFEDRTREMVSRSHFRRSATHPTSTNGLR